jgi:hypothetical protein
MKTIRTICIIFFYSLFLFSCTKEINSPSDEGQNLELRSADNCADCLDEWPDSRETISYGAFNLSLVAEQDADGITYLHLVRSPGTFTSLSYAVIFHDVSAAATTTLLTQADASAGGGAVSDRDLLKSKTGTALSISDFPIGWEACDYIEVKFTVVNGVGFGGTPFITAKYYLRELCEISCEESFSYDLDEDGSSVVFTYISPVAIDPAQIKFTCPHITGFTATDGKEYTVNPGNGQGSPTVLTWNGAVAACTPITFAFSFDPDCDQNSAGFANLWTDCKVNGVSKKNTNTPTIRYDCPE